MTQQPKKQYDPYDPFDGLTTWEWVKTIFRTRASTLKQSDATINMLMQSALAEGEKTNQLRELNTKLSKLVLIQNHALIGVLRELPDGDVKAMVMSAINTANEPL